MSSFAFSSEVAVVVLEADPLEGWLGVDCEFGEGVLVLGLAAERELALPGRLLLGGGRELVRGRVLFNLVAAVIGVRRAIVAVT